MSANSENSTAEIDIHLSVMNLNEEVSVLLPSNVKKYNIIPRYIQEVMSHVES